MERSGQGIFCRERWRFSPTSRLGRWAERRVLKTPPGIKSQSSPPPLSRRVLFAGHRAWSGRRRRGQLNVGPLRVCPRFRGSGNAGGSERVAAHVARVEAFFGGAGFDHAQDRRAAHGPLRERLRSCNGTKRGRSSVSAGPELLASAVDPPTTDSRASDSPSAT